MLLPHHHHSRIITPHIMKGISFQKSEPFQGIIAANCRSFMNSQNIGISPFQRRYFHHQRQGALRQNGFHSPTLTNCSGMTTPSARSLLTTRRVLNQSLIGQDAPIRRMASTNSSSNGKSSNNTKSHNFVFHKYYFLSITALTAAIVLLGGLTRLTDSGLSMTSWTITGSRPPLNEEEWNAEFDRYKQFPEYKRGRSDMTLSEFKYIFFYEYTHRMLGRFIGATYFAGAFYMGLRGMYKVVPSLRWRTLLLGCLIGCQGFIGWWMVKSGLDDSEGSLMSKYNTIARVSQYRLVTHLSMAFTIYALSFWSFLNAHFEGVEWKRTASLQTSTYTRRLRACAPGLTALIFLTALSGGFVAGMDAGLVYNEFPMMGEGLVPKEIFDLKPWWLNFFENASTVQFDHRLLATVTGTLTLMYYGYGRRGIQLLPAPLRMGLHALGIMVSIQYLLGLTTLLSLVDVRAASAHQMGSLTLFTISLYVLNLMRRLPK